VIKSNINEIIKGINDFEKKQLPFAESLALNRTALIAQNAIKHKIDRDFNVTSKSWNKVGGKFGIKKKAATKRNPEVTIFIPNINTWIEDHEEGDVRSGMQLIPTKQFAKRYKLKTNKAIKRKALTLLSDKSKYRIFEATINGDRYIMQRLKGKIEGKRRLRSKKTGRLLKPKKVLRRDAVPLFLIKNSVKEKARLGFYETITKVFEKNIEKEFSKAFDYAMETAR